MLHSELCGNVAKSEKQTLPILITGVGRSGTKFIAEFLQNLGVDVSHDNQGPFADGGVSWPQTFNEEKCGFMDFNWDSSPLFPEEKTRRHFRFKEVFHVVRDPLKSILSRANGGDFISTQSVQYCACHVDLSYEAVLNRSDLSSFQKSLIFALRSWVLFNAFLDHLDVPLLRSESFFDERHHEQISRIFGGKVVKVPLDRNSEHTKKFSSLTWNDLYSLDPSFALMAEKMANYYGYKTENKLDDKKIRCFFTSTNKWTCI